MTAISGFNPPDASGTAGEGRPLRLVQITDCHLGERVGTRLLNMDTDRSLAAVLELVRAQQPAIDLLLATGDLSDQGGPAAYRRFLQATRDLGTHTRWLPGNHDDPAVMRKLLGADVRLQRNLLLGNWQVVTLDSTIAGEVGGMLAQHELELLCELLRAEPQRHTLICLHHPVLPIGSAWIDPQRVANAEQFWAALAPFAQVRAVLCGHVHQQFEVLRGDIRVITSPSTCVQFAPGSADFRVDGVPPGYRWLDLYPDGRIDTEVVRVSGCDFEVDLTASGY